MPSLLIAYRGNPMTTRDDGEPRPRRTGDCPGFFYNAQDLPDPQRGADWRPQGLPVAATRPV